MIIVTDRSSGISVRLWGFGNASLWVRIVGIFENLGGVLRTGMKLDYSWFPLDVCWFFVLGWSFFFNEFCLLVSRIISGTVTIWG